MEFVPPQARYWVVQWHRLPWGDAADFLRTITSLNHRQCHVDDDAKVRIVISHRDPGVQNWLDAGGRRDGLLMNRWIWTTDNPVPEGTVVAVDELHTVLPESTPRFSAAERAAQLAARRDHLARRYD